ncbi:MAG: VWA domain-containing protein [Planctomycetota bacterium]
MPKLTTRPLLLAGVMTMTLGITAAVQSETEIEHGAPAIDLPADKRGKAGPAPTEGPPLDTEEPPQTIQVTHPHGPLADPPGADPQPKPDPEAASAPLIQIAILLDTSNSMDGLIDQAKAQLWMIVNRFAKAQRDGVDPNFQIALFQYGNTSLPAEEGYIQQVVSFTNDLDKLSAALFALTTNGGDEYCGQVMDEALTRLPWSTKRNDFKAIYIAGNEPFTQGNVHYVGVCKRAKDKGVLVNTIHCGKHQAGVAGKWQHGAHLAGGSFMTINQDRSLVTPAAPQDDELARLNTELNGTYLHYGKKGEARLRQQRELDEANTKLSADAGAQRAEAKASGLYLNAHWDLIDAENEKDFDLSKVPNEELPKAMQGMTLEQKKAHIEKMASQRRAIQGKIKALAAEREKHIATERRKAADKEGETLGEAINKTVDEQLEARGYEVEAETPEATEPKSETEKKAEAK